MKRLFHIENTGGGQPSVLLLGIGSDHLKYGFYSRENEQVSGMGYYELDEDELAEALPGMIAEINGKHIEQVVASSVFPEVLLLPRHKSSGFEKAWSDFYEQPESMVMKDEIPEWQISNIFSLPAGIKNSLEKSFPRIRFTHEFSCLLKNYNGFSEEDQIAVDFSTRRFSLMVKKQGRLELAQVYSYVTPLDVVYYLLKITSELEMDQSKLLLILSGLVEKDSALYKALNDYFLHIVFPGASRIKLPDQELPPHFFASLHNLAACAS